jgi:hypothetical protein
VHQLLLKGGVVREILSRMGLSDINDKKLKALMKEISGGGL